MVITNTCPHICKQSTDVLKCLTKQHPQTALYLLSRAHQRMTNQKPRKAETAVDLLSKSAGWHLLQSPSAVNLSQTTMSCHLCSFLPGWSSFWCTHCRVKEAFSNHCKSIYSLIFFTKLRSTWGEAGKTSSDAIMSCFPPPGFFLCSLGKVCHLCYYTITQLLHY